MNTPRHTDTDTLTTETKHTKGPWYAEAADSREFTYNVIDSVNCYVAIVSERGHTPETTANANLIAAAPELLDACKALSRLAVMRECYCANLSADYMTEHGSRCGVCLMRAAIAKTEGTK